MKRDIFINVGIPTDGAPRIRHEDGLNIVENQLIGLGFHWQRSFISRLPGELYPIADGVFTLLNRVPLETYLECVVGSEMNPAAPLEFLKAHAIISRSWALGKIMRGRNEHPQAMSESNPVSKPATNPELGPGSAQGKIRDDGRIIDWQDESDHSAFDVCSDDHCQRYQGVQPLSEAAAEAIRSTSGLVLLDKDGNLVDARFSKCCGGRTELFSTCWQDEERNCLESFEDPWCDLSGLSEEERGNLLQGIVKEYDMDNGGGYRWETEVDKKLIARNLKDKLGVDIGEISNMEVLERGASGRIKRLEIRGGDGRIQIGKELTIRRIFSTSHLYSSAFEWADKGNTFHLRGKGWGHGVGLCQIGAAAMALAGRGFRDILGFYYPGSRIAEINPTEIMPAEINKMETSDIKSFS